MVICDGGAPPWMFRCNHQDQKLTVCSISHTSRFIYRDYRSTNIYTWVLDCSVVQLLLNLSILKEQLSEQSLATGHSFLWQNHMNLCLHAGHTKLVWNYSCFMSSVLFLSFLKYHFHKSVNFTVPVYIPYHVFHVVVVQVVTYLHVLKSVVPSTQHCLVQFRNTWCNLSHSFVQNKPPVYHTQSPGQGGNWPLCLQSTAVVGLQQQCQWGGLGG